MRTTACIALAGLLSLASIEGARAEGKSTELPPFQSAIEKATAGKKDILVFLHGSDWCDDGETVRERIWENPRLQNRFPDLVRYAFDFRDLPDPERKKAEAAALKGFPIPLHQIHDLPALVYLDRNARPIGILRGIDPRASFQDVASQIAALHRNRVERDTHWQEVERADGPEKAVRLGKGLDALGWNPRLLKYYDATVREMAAADPADTSGYVQKYRFRARHHAAAVWKLVTAKKHDEALSFLAGLLANKRLATVQRQQLHSLRYSVYHAWEGHGKQADDALRKVVDLDPKSFTGRAAANLLQKRGSGA